MPLAAGYMDVTVRGALGYAERAVTTTTLSLGPSQVGAPSAGGGTAVPVAAIVGGVVAGALLAIVVTVGWVCWGKAIKRTHTKQQREVESLRRTRQNTLQNARISKPRIRSYRPQFPPPPEKKVKFAGFDHGSGVNEKSVDKMKEVPPISFMREPNPARKPNSTCEPKPPGLPRTGPVIFPKRAAGTRPTPLGQGSQTSTSRVPATEIRTASLIPAKKLPHKPSMTDSVSVYSTASGEERQIRVPTNLILAALGNLGSSVDAALNRNSNSDRQSWSSGWSLFPRNNQNGGTGSRLSQASYESMSGVPVGTAL